MADLGTFYPLSRPQDDSKLLYCLAVSLLLHCLFVFLRLLPNIPLTSPSEPERIFEVRLEKTAATEKHTIPPETTPPPEDKSKSFTLPKSQIVSPSLNAPETPPKETRLLSERDSSVTHQQIKRGEVEETAKQDTSKQPTAKLKTQALHEKSLPQNTSHGDSKLRLGAGELLEQFGARKSALNPSEASASDAKSNVPASSAESAEYKPFSKNRSLSFTGPIGSADFLPGIPDGEVTLLNAKAERHAVFVRRVALQVFGELRRSGWQLVPFNQMQQIQDHVTLEAIMDRTGKFIRAEIIDSSGSRSFDQTAFASVQHGAWDQNPPVAALADDGKIHFIFQARCWARRVPKAGGAGVGEERWLLLSTGLK